MNETNAQSLTHDQRMVLQAFSRALGREAHVLAQHPDLLWQQLYNQLQWADGEQGNGPVSIVIAPAFKSKTTPGQKTWLHNRCWTRESETFIRLLIGHTDWVNDCTFSPDGRTLASAGEDNTVRLWDSSTGAEIAVLKGHTAFVSSCAVSGRFLWSQFGLFSLR